MHPLNILSKAQLNQVQDVSQKVTLHHPNSHSIAMNGLFKYNGLRLIHLCFKLVGSSQTRPFWSMCIREKWHVMLKPKLCSYKWTCSKLILHIYIVNSEYANGSFVIHNLWITGYSPLMNTFWEYPFLSTPIRISPVNKRLRNFGQIQFIAKSHLCTE